MTGDPRTIDALIEKLRAADKSSRALDREIIIALGLQNSCPFWLRNLDGLSPMFLTSSIDDAIRLIPKVHSTDIHSDILETFPTGYELRALTVSEFEANIIYFPTWNVEPGPIGSGWGRTAPLAICMAALDAIRATNVRRGAPNEDSPQVQEVVVP